MTATASSSRPLTNEESKRAWASLTFDYSTNELRALVCLSTRATKREQPLGCSVEFLHTIEADRLIESVVGGDTKRLDGLTVQGDSAVVLLLGPIRVVSTDDDRCVSPVAYIEARRAGVLGAATRRSLDAQLPGIDPAVIKARPRFGG